MSDRYCRIIAVLGLPDAGKTASLVSLYLLLAHDKLDDYEFADSKTLKGLDEISRGARRWNEGHAPPQMTAHTELVDDRTAGFMHFRLFPRSGGAPVDILLSDLPGEWSTSLIDNNRTDRWSFLTGSDAIWLMVDGQQLLNSETRNLAVHRTNLLLQRLAAFLTSPPPITLVITRRDLGMPSEATLASLTREAFQRGLSLRIAHIASFSDAGGPIQAGAGLSELVSETTRAPPQQTVFWPDADVGDLPRAMLRFRKIS